MAGVEETLNPTGAASPLDLARRLLGLAEQQFAAALAGDWERALEYAEVRVPLVAALGSADTTHLDTGKRQALVEMLAQVQRCDDAVARLAQDARRATIDELRQLERGHAMASGYRRSGPVATRAALLDETV